MKKFESFDALNATLSDEFEINCDFSMFTFITSDSIFSKDNNCRYVQVELAYEDYEDKRAVLICSVENELHCSAGVMEFASYALRENNVDTARKYESSIIRSCFNLDHLACDDEDSKLIGDTFLLYFDTLLEARQFVCEQIMKSH